MINPTDKPSIAELLRIQAEIDAGSWYRREAAALRAATPVLLEIAAAGLALRQQETAANMAGCAAATSPLGDPAWERLEVENVKLRACVETYHAALAKVRP